MKNTGRKMKLYIIIGIALVIGIYMTVQGIRCGIAVSGRRTLWSDYNAKSIELSYGRMSYVDEGEGEVILSVHGIFGGYDQAYDTCRDFVSDFRIIAPSRFGYLGSDVMGEGTSSEQAAAYTELLDRLKIDKVYLLATSAGGSPAIRFALDYPERTKGLILYCSAMPLPQKPEKYAEYAGPPAFMCSDYAMFLLSPLFNPIMGMSPSTVYSMVPVSERKEGVILDASLTNPDMARNFDTYDIENLKVPVLILHSKDDRLAKYSDVTNALSRFPDCRLVSFETGGHLMEGHAEEAKKAVLEFAGKN